MNEDEIKRILALALMRIMKEWHWFRSKQTQIEKETAQAIGVYSVYFDLCEGDIGMTKSMKAPTSHYEIEEVEKIRKVLEKE